MPYRAFCLICIKEKVTARKFSQYDEENADQVFDVSKLNEHGIGRCVTQLSDQLGNVLSIPLAQMPSLLHRMRKSLLSSFTG